MNEVSCRGCERNEARRSAWGDGPWRNEPNRVEWKHAGFPCIAHRGGGGAWCGYVGLPPGYSLHGKTYDEAYELFPELEVHGGLTYSKACSGHICHVPKPGEPDNIWWLGFDCCHGGDATPGEVDKDELLTIFGGDVDLASRSRGHYWTLAEAQAETNRLAEQLAAISAT